jgi:carbonic anhydrase
VKLALAGKPQHVDRNLIEEAARMNVAHSMQRLTERSSVLSELVTAGKFKIIGGIYDLHSGEVNFID